MKKKKILIGVIVVLSLFDLTCFAFATSNNVKTYIAKKMDNSNVQESTINELPIENIAIENKTAENTTIENSVSEKPTNTVNDDVKEKTETQKAPEVKKETSSKTHTKSAENKKTESKKESTNKVQEQSKTKTETTTPTTKKATTQAQTQTTTQAQSQNTQEKNTTEKPIQTTTEKAKDEEKYVRNDAMINKIREVIKNNESEYMKEYGYTIVVDSSIKEKTNQFTFTETRVKGYITYKFGTIKIYAEDYFKNVQLIMTECYIF